MSAVSVNSIGGSRSSSSFDEKSSSSDEGSSNYSSNCDVSSGSSSSDGNSSGTVVRAVGDVWRVDGVRNSQKHVPDLVIAC